MIRGTKYGWTAMTLLGLLAGAANADEVGLVQITDRPPQPSKAGPAPAAKAAPGSPAAQAAPGSPANAAPANAGPAPAACADAGAYAGDGGAAGRARLCGCLRAILAYNPGAGFRPPETVPIDRDAVMYHQYWPAKFYGQPGWRLAPSFPMVYMPTDTTQLGVYYARVPQWLPNPRMYPRPPRPDQWNRRVVMADHPAANINGGMATESGQPVPAGGPTPDALGSPAPHPGGNAQQPTMPPPPKMAPAPAFQGVPSLQGD